MNSLNIWIASRHGPPSLHFCMPLMRCSSRFKIVNRFTTLRHFVSIWSRYDALAYLCLGEKALNCNAWEPLGNHCKRSVVSRRLLIGLAESHQPHAHLSTLQVRRPNTLQIAYSVTGRLTHSSSSPNNSWAIILCIYLCNGKANLISFLQFSLPVLYLEIFEQFWLCSVSGSLLPFRAFAEEACPSGLLICCCQIQLFKQKCWPTVGQFGLDNGSTWIYDNLSVWMNWGELLQTCSMVCLSCRRMWWSWSSPDQRQRRNCRALPRLRKVPRVAYAIPFWHLGRFCTPWHILVYHGISWHCRLIVYK